MRVDIVHLLWSNLRLLQCNSKAVGGAHSIRARCGHEVGELVYRFQLIDRLRRTWATLGTKITVMMRTRLGKLWRQGTLPASSWLALPLVSWAEEPAAGGGPARDPKAVHPFRNNRR